MAKCDRTILFLFAVRLTAVPGVIARYSTATVQSHEQEDDMLTSIKQVTGVVVIVLGTIAVSTIIAGFTVAMINATW